MSQSEAYSKAVEQSALENVVLVSSSFEMDPRVLTDNDQLERYIDQRVTNIEFDDQSQLLFGTVECRVWACLSGVENKRENEEAPSVPKLLALEAKYMVIFKILGEHDREVIDMFFRKMGPFTTWPYFRVHVAGVAAEAHIDLPVLPIKKLLFPIKSVGGYIDPEAPSSSDE